MMLQSGSGLGNSAKGQIENTSLLFPLMPLTANDVIRGTELPLPALAKDVHTEEKRNVENPTNKSQKRG